MLRAKVPDRTDCVCLCTACESKKLNYSKKSALLNKLTYVLKSWSRASEEAEEEVRLSDRRQSNSGEKTYHQRDHGF